MHPHAVAVTHTWSGFRSTNLPSNTLYKQAHWPTDAGTHTHKHTSWPCLSVVSRSADTWKDTLERSPFHSNSAGQHLARTRWLSPTVVKGMRVLNSTAAHSSLPTEWEKKSLSWAQYSTGCTLQSTHSPVVHYGVRDLKFEWTSKWELLMSVKYFWLYSDGSHSKCWKLSCHSRMKTLKKGSPRTDEG